MSPWLRVRNVNRDRGKGLTGFRLYRNEWQPSAANHHSKLLLKGEKMEHEWGLVEFVFASWIECSCGFRPNSQEEMDAHK